TAAAVLAMLRGLPDAVATLPRRPSWVDRLDVHAAAARSALPARAGEVAEVAERVTALLAALPEPALVPTHGDLNVANLFVTDGRPSALIDVDALGPGHLEDDLATVLAHLAVLPSLAPAQYTGVPAVLADWLAVLAGAVGARGLLARTAAERVEVAGDGDAVRVGASDRTDPEVTATTADASGTPTTTPPATAPADSPTSTRVPSPATPATQTAPSPPSPVTASPVTPASAASAPSASSGG